MSIREYCKRNGIDIIGKLRRVSAEQLRDPSIPTWVDEIGNEFWRVVNPTTSNEEWVCIGYEGGVY